MTKLSEYVGELPNICGQEAELPAPAAAGSLYPNVSARLASADAVCAIALHMHQPLIPAGGGDLQTAAIISNLQYMMENQGIGDNHNAPVFHWCYKRIGEFIPQLVGEGKEPRAMLEYSGTLFHGLRRMGLHDVLETLQHITSHPDYAHCVEWLGCPWGHAVAPSTPVQDYRLHVQAFRHHFAAIFGTQALSRVVGFSPSEMALPNHPDVAYEFVRTLRDNGYRWVLVQEHTVEQPTNGHGPERKHVPHRLICRNSHGESVSIIAIIKTQGSDTKLVAQMQPYYEARGLGRVDLKHKPIPQLVTQIADGENGGVMMNEFPPKFMEVARESTGSRTPMVNVTEYLDYLQNLGIEETDLPELQPLFHKRIWERVQPGDGPQKLATAIEELRKEDHRFHMEGGSWTSDISWTKGYDNVLGPMEEASAAFYEKAIKPGVSTTDARYRNALFHLMTSQTSCYRYWGQGLWTDYGRELCRRTIAIARHDL